MAPSVLKKPIPVFAAILPKGSFLRYPALPVYEQRFPCPFAGMPPKVYFPNYPLFQYIPNTGYIPISLRRPIIPTNTPLLSSKKSPVITQENNDESFDKIKASSGNDEGSVKCDLSLSDDDNGAKEKRIMGTSAYKKRNVYKSIIRHMFGYMRRHREEVMAMLRSKGYRHQEIEHAFFKINYYNDMERQKGNPKKSQAIIKKITKTKCIYTYLLQKTLDLMLKKWETGKLGKVSVENREIYREVCTKYKNEVAKLLGNDGPEKEAGGQ